MENGDWTSPWADAPALVFWELTRACDLKCKHCRAEAIPRRDPGELSTREILIQLENLGREMKGVVVFTGGDPFRRQDLTEIVAACGEAGLKPALTPSTTPELRRDRLAELQEAGLRMMALSVDGPDVERHDQFRGQEGSFEHTLRGVEAARDLGIPLQINTTVCRETQSWIQDVGERVASWDVFRWALFFLVRTGNGLHLSSPDPERCTDIFSHLHRWSREHETAVKTTNAPHFRRWRIQNTDRSPTPGVIEGDGILFIAHDGDVYPGGFLPESRGNIRDRSPLDIYRNDELFQQIRARSFSGRCGRCEFRIPCGGSRANARAELNNPLGEDPRCLYEPEREENSPGAKPPSTDRPSRS